MTASDDFRQQKKPGSRHRFESVLTSGRGSLFCYCMIVWRKMMYPKRTVSLYFHPNLQKGSWVHWGVLCPFKEYLGANRRTTHRNNANSRTWIDWGKTRVPVILLCTPTIARYVRQLDCRWQPFHRILFASLSSTMGRSTVWPKVHLWIVRITIPRINRSEGNYQRNDDSGVPPLAKSHALRHISFTLWLASQPKRFFAFSASAQKAGRSPSRRGPIT